MKSSVFAILLSLILGCDLLYAQTVYTFTAAGATGNTGPTQGMADTAYSGTTLDGDVTVAGGIQTWMVPTSGPYLIEAYGGQGYGSFGGRGAHISGEFNLTAGQTLKILVGQAAGPYLNYPSTTYNHQFGGGGGSFVTLSDDTPLIVAGGGGGNHGASYVTSADGQITEDGAPGANALGIGAGGTGGMGGQQATSADGGGGLLGNGAGVAGGQAFVNGGLGGIDEGTGGFGAGGGTSSWNNYRGGGGGGYSGGGGGNNGSTCCPAGGGGGSYNAGTSPVNLAGVQLGDGLVRITAIGPSMGKEFVPDQVPLGTVSTLTFTIDNPLLVSATDLDFTDNLPAGMVVATPSNASTTCSGGTLTATAGSGVITYTGGTVASSSSCTITADVITDSGGVFVNTTGEFTSSGGNSGPASDTLTVAPPPAFAKLFSPDTMILGGVSTLTFTIDNSASTLAATGLDFTDNLPAGMVVATPSNASTDCTGGTLTAADGTGTITYTGGTVAAATVCTVTVDVTGVTGGTHLNTTGDLTSSAGSSGTASDTLTVNGPPAFAKVFSPGEISVGQSSTLTFTIDNSASTLAATGLDFTDNLPAGMVVATPSNASTDCTGGTLTAADASGTITYAGGTVGASSVCTISVDVTGITAGAHVNTTGDLSSSIGNSGAASDTLTVSPPPAFAKSFSPVAVSLGESSTLTFTIDNTASGLEATALDFTDNFPAGMEVADPNGASTTCAGGTLTAVAGSAVVTYTGGSVAASASCTVTVDVVTVSGGSLMNTTGDLTSSAGNSGPASAILSAEPPPTFAMEFNPASVNVGEPSTLTFTIDNSASGLPATSLSFSHNLPAGLEVSNPAGASTTCSGGTLTATEGSLLIGYSGGSVAAGVSCLVTVDVVATAAGDYLNTSGELTSSNGSSGTATDTLMVVGTPPVVEKVFNPLTIFLGETTTMTITIDNTASAAAATNLDFTDDMPDGMFVADPSNASTTCTGGTLTAVPGSNTVSYSGGTVAAGGTCTVSVSVVSGTPGESINTVVVSSSSGMSPAAAGPLAVSAPGAIPTLNQWMLLLLAMLLAGVAMWRIT